MPADKPKRQVFRAVTNAVQTATAGGVIDSDQRVLTPDRRTFIGISYQGDVDGWRHDIEEGAKRNGLSVAAIAGSSLTCIDETGSVEAMERCGNRRPRVERLVSAWNQGTHEGGDLAGERDDPLIGGSAEPRKRPRTRLTDEEVDAMRTARDAGFSVTALARQFDVHRGTVWAKTRRSRIDVPRP